MSAIHCYGILSEQRKIANQPTSVEKMILLAKLSSANIQYVCYHSVITTVKVKVNQSRYRPGVAQRVPGS